MVVGLLALVMEATRPTDPTVGNAPPVLRGGVKDTVAPDRTAGFFSPSDPKVMVRVGLLAKCEIDDAPISTGWTAGFFARRDIARRTTGRTNCTMKATDAGMPINMAMKETKRTRVSLSQSHDMASRLPGPGAGSCYGYLPCYRAA